VATIDRKSSIRKAPAADVVDALTNQSHVETKAISQAEAAVSPVNVVIGSVEENRAVGRPGPGRPRSKRRMEPFSSKIEIGLRDDLDEYLAIHGMTVVDFLDQAIRAQLKR